MSQHRRFTTWAVLLLALGCAETAAQNNRSAIAVPAQASQLRPTRIDAAEPRLVVSSEAEARPVGESSVLRRRLPKVLDAVQAELPGIEIGFTFYDFQTNGAMANRLAYTADGPDKYVQMLWMVSKDSTRDVTTRIPGFAGNFRGTHYNFIDVSNPDSPERGVDEWDKVEDTRSGWPSIVQFKDGLIGTPSHPPIRFFGNSGVGDQPLQFAEVTDPSALCLWPRAAADGDGNAHLIYNHNLGSDQQPSNQVAYRRSTDGGYSWSEETQFTGSGSPEGNLPVGLGGDTYAVTARGKKVVVAYTDNSLRMLSRTSTDGGATWPSELARVIFAPNYTDVDSSENEWGTFEVRSDTVPTPNGHIDVIIDGEGLTHYIVGVVPSHVVRKDTNGTRQGTIFMLNNRANLRTSGMGHIREGSNIIRFMAPPAGGEWDGNGYAMNLRFFDNASRWPQLGIDAENNLYCTYGSFKNGDTKLMAADTTGGNQQNEPDTLTNVNALNSHIWITYLKAGEDQWSRPFDLTPDGMNCQYPSLCDEVVNGRLYIGYSASPNPGDRVTNVETPADAARVMFVAVDATKIDAPVSVHERDELNAEVTIAPNPAQGVTSVRIVSPSSGTMSVSVLSSIGERVLSSTSPNNAGSWDVVIPTDGLAAGLYNVVVEQAGRRTVRALSVVR